MTSDERLKLKYKNQRARRGFSDFDVFEIDTWFIRIIPKMQKELKKNVVKIGISPNIFREEFYELNKDRINCSKGDLLILGHLIDESLENEMDNYAHNRWIEELDKMIVLFTEANEETCSMKKPYKRAYTTSLHRTSLKELKAKKEEIEYKMSKKSIEHREKISKLYIEEENKRLEYIDKCKKEALDMFVKYFDQLWW